MSRIEAVPRRFRCSVCAAEAELVSTHGWITPWHQHDDQSGYPMVEVCPECSETRGTQDPCPKCGAA